MTTAAPAVPMKRKWENPTPVWVGANVFNAEGKPHAIPVEPGGAIWLSPEEERMTAEAPRLPQDNPFVKEWDAPIEVHPETGEVLRTERRQGMLVPSAEPPRPITSERYIPESPETATAGGGTPPPPEPPAPPAAPEEGEEQTTTGDQIGAAPDPQAPPPQGQPAPDEIVGTPDAVRANDEAMAARQHAPVPVGPAPPRGTDAIGVPPPRREG